MDRQNLNYEELYDRLLERGEALHRSNKKRIRAGLIFLAVFTVAMILIRWITDSDRVVFMVLWVVGMFAASIYLISVEYIDSSIQKTLEEVTEKETSFGELIPDSEMVREMVRGRIAGLQADHRRGETAGAGEDERDGEEACPEQDPESEGAE